MSAARAQASAEGSTAAQVRSRPFLDLTLLAALLVLGFAIASPLLHSAQKRERIRLIGAEARSLHESFARYVERNRAYPEPSTARPFDTEVLEALRRAGYYQGKLGDFLVDGRVDAYDAPRDEGVGREYWVEMTLAEDRSLRLLVAHSDDAPLGHGKWMDGAFLFRDGKVEPL